MVRLFKQSFDELAKNPQGNYRDLLTQSDLVGLVSSEVQGTPGEAMRQLAEKAVERGANYVVGVEFEGIRARFSGVIAYGDAYTLRKKRV